MPPPQYDIKVRGREPIGTQCTPDGHFFERRRAGTRHDKVSGEQGMALSRRDLQVARERRAHGDHVGQGAAYVGPPVHQATRTAKVRRLLSRLVHPTHPQEKMAALRVLYGRVMHPPTSAAEAGGGSERLGWLGRGQTHVPPFVKRSVQ